MCDMSEIGIRDGITDMMMQILGMHVRKEVFGET